MPSVVLPIARVIPDWLDGGTGAGFPLVAWGTAFTVRFVVFGGDAESVTTIAYVCAAVNPVMASVWFEVMSVPSTVIV
jgi:hypothetical protein